MSKEAFIVLESFYADGLIVAVTLDEDEAIRLAKEASEERRVYAVPMGEDICLTMYPDEDQGPGNFRFVGDFE